MRRTAVVALLVLSACKEQGTERTPPPPGTPAAPDKAVTFAQGGFELPTVGGRVLPLDPGAPLLVASTSVVSFEGAQVVPLVDGTVAPEEREGGALGAKVPRVTAILAAHAKAQPPATGGDVLGFAIDRRLSYGLLFDLIYSAKSPPATRTRFAVLVRAGSDVGALPLTLPDRGDLATDERLGRPSGQVNPREAGDDRSGGVVLRDMDPRVDTSLQLVLSISGEELRLWSISGQEGTLPEPRLRVPRADPTALKQVGDVLAEIVKRRWAGKQRGDDTRDIIVMAEAATPMQLIAEAIAAVRATPAGEELFPDVRLARGFEAGPSSTPDLPPAAASSALPVAPALGAPGIRGMPGVPPPRGRITIVDKQVSGAPTLTPEIVLRKLRASYFTALVRCYNGYLAKDPAARGKVALSFTVDERGRAVNGQARGFSSEVDACFTSLSKTWVFPIPKTKRGDATEAGVAITLALTPD